MSQWNTQPKYVQGHILIDNSETARRYSINREGDSMPYPEGHRTEVKKRIVESARRLFNRHGFEQVSLDEIMSGAGLTHGGFYNYFKSKSDLYVEALNCFFTDPEWKNCWEGVEINPSSGDFGSQVIRAYLSRQHFEDVENSCPMVALPADVTRGDARLRRAFEIVFAAMVSILERSMKKRGGEARARAQATAALCIGGMVIARAMENRSAADDLRDACMRVALELGGRRERPMRRATRTAKMARASKRVGRRDRVHK
jgi:TetR/AcrR family transcriptional repressor of nem operon